MTITIQHYTGRTIEVKDTTVTKSGEIAYAAVGYIEGQVYTCYFPRKVGKKDAAKVLADQYVERQQRLAAEAADPCKFL